jgi:LysM repeat protein
MTHKLVIFLFVLLITGTACALTSSAPAPTPIILVATPLPSQTPTPVTPTAQPSATTASSGSTVNTGNTVCYPRTDWATYIVVQGDTLGKLAERTGTTIQQLAAANCLSNANVISVGQPLRVPRQPATPVPPTATATATSIPVPIDLNPVGDPPDNICAVRNPNSSVPVMVYLDTNVNAGINARLWTWAPYLATWGAWYQIGIPDSGGNYVHSSQTVLVGAACPSPSPELPQ